MYVTWEKEMEEFILMADNMIDCVKLLLDKSKLRPL